MELFEQYRKARDQIYEYFDYKEQWHVSPIEECTKYWWHLDHNKIIYVSGDNKESALENIRKEKYYSSVLIAIYRKSDYTMIEADTQTDGNCFLCIFDSAKELSEEDCKEFEDWF